MMDSSQYEKQINAQLQIKKNSNWKRKGRCSSLSVRSVIEITNVILAAPTTHQAWLVHHWLLSFIIKHAKFMPIVVIVVSSIVINGSGPRKTHCTRHNSNRSYTSAHGRWRMSPEEGHAIADAPKTLVRCISPAQLIYFLRSALLSCPHNKQV